MKIDRLLGIVILLLNRDIVSAKELADRFEVSVRTINRDMESINMAGIPIYSVQGSQGGFGIVDSYKVDNRIVSADDMYLILKSLQGIGNTIDSKKVVNTIDKFKSLIPEHRQKDLAEKDEKLHFDFSFMVRKKENEKNFSVIEEAVENNRIIEFEYTDAKKESCKRIVEPMSIAFKWYSWYLYGYCRLREDFRIFRLSRMRNIEVKRETFKRREKKFEEVVKDKWHEDIRKNIDMRLHFNKEMKIHIEEYYSGSKMEYQEDGSVIVNVSFPEDDWVYGHILSYGSKVKVLEPERLREIVKKSAEDILELYKEKK